MMEYSRLKSVLISNMSHYVLAWTPTPPADPVGRIIASAVSMATPRQRESSVLLYLETANLREKRDIITM